MKKLFVAGLMAFLSFAANAADMEMPIRSVADGDTIRSYISLPCPLCAVSVRIRGIDTPESNYLAKCPAEKAKGLEAKEYLKSLLVGHKTMMTRNIKWDKYGGRINAHVFVDGIDIGQRMIEKGYARPYTGQGPKSNWCI